MGSVCGSLLIENIFHSSARPALSLALIKRILYPLYTIPLATGN